MSKEITHISFRVKLNEVNNPELFELDEAQELAFIIMKDYMQASSDFWKPMDIEAFPDGKYISKYIKHNEYIMNFIEENPGKWPKNPYMYEYLSFQVDENIINTMKMKGIINRDLSNIGVLFIQRVYPKGYISPNKEEISTFGESAPGSTIVAVVYDQAHTLVEIKQALISILVHEINHDYDRTEYEDFADPGDYFGVNNVQQTPEQERELQTIFAIMHSPAYKHVISRGLYAGIKWITSIWELKSITKQFLKYCEYKSIDYKDISNPELLDELNQWLDRYIGNKFYSSKDVYNSEEKRKKISVLMKRVIVHVKGIILYIINKLNLQQKIKFR